MPGRFSARWTRTEKLQLKRTRVPGFGGLEQLPESASSEAAVRCWTAPAWEQLGPVESDASPHPEVWGKPRWLDDRIG